MALFFTYVLPLILPTVVYMLWRLISARHATNDEAHRADDDPVGGAATVASGDDLWRDAPWPWLAIAGVVLLAVVLLVGVFVHGSPPAGQYVPPRMEDGHIVPGELRENGPAGSPSGTR